MERLHAELCENLFEEAPWSAGKDSKAETWAIGPAVKGGYCQVPPVRFAAGYPQCNGSCAREQGVEVSTPHEVVRTRPMRDRHPVNLSSQEAEWCSSQIHGWNVPILTARSDVQPSHSLENGSECIASIGWKGGRICCRQRLRRALSYFALYYIGGIISTQGVKCDHQPRYQLG